MLWLLAWLEDRRFGSRPPRQRRTALLSGAFLGIDLILWHHSIGDIGAGLATVLANIQVVLVPLVAWVWLSERPGRQVLAALPIALLGVVLISGVLEHGAYGRDPGRGTVYALLAGIAYVGFLLLLRRGGADLRTRAMPRARPPASPHARRPSHPAAGPLFDATAAATVVCLVIGLIMGDADLAPDWPSAGWLITLALTSQVIEPAGETPSYL